MQKTPTISIVIPCYNEEKNIANCLKYILRQNVFPEQIIIINNNSTDNSIEIAEHFKKSFTDLNIDFQISNVKEQGIIPSRRVGFQRANSDLIASIDVDTQINQNWVKNAKKIFIKNKKLIALSGPLYFRNTNIIIKIRQTLNFILYTFFKYFLIL